VIVREWSRFILLYILTGAVGTVLIAWGTAFVDVGAVRPVRPVYDKPADDPLPAVPGTAVTAAAPTCTTVPPPAGRTSSSTDAAPTASSDRETTTATPVEQWAVILTPQAKAYDKAGKYLRRLPAGTVLDLSGTLKSGAEELTVGHVFPSAPDAAPVVVRSRDLDLHRGSVKRVSDRERALSIHRAELLAKLQNVQSSSSGQLRRENPYVDDLRKTRKAYKDYWNKVNDIKAKWDTSQGEDHIAYGEELRKLKGQDIRIGMAYEQAQENYDEWNTLHPPTSRDNARAAALQAELARVKEQLREFDKPSSVNP